MGEVCTPRLAVLVGTHGRGSNMVAIADACAAGQVPARLGLVVAGTEDAPAVETARRKGLEVAILPHKSDDYAGDLLSALKAKCCGWLCLAGFLKLLPPEVLAAYPDRILNIHPALLPKHGGKGMYGMHVHEAVLAAGDTESGCTVHMVNERYDEGRIVLQLTCPVEPNDTPESLAARVLELEHRAYPEALRMVITGDER